MSRAQKDLELWQAWKADPSPANQDAMLEALSGTINARVNTFSRAAVPPAAVRGFATATALQALQSYNPSKGASVNTYVNWHLKKTQSFVGKHQNLGRIPDDRINRITEYKNAKAELTELNGSPPNTMQLAEYLKWSPKEVGRMRAEQRSDHIASVSLEPDIQNYQDDSHARDVLRNIYMELDPEERLVYEHTLGLYGRPRLAAKGIAQTLNMSPAKVSRIRRRIDDKLRSHGV